MGQRCSEYWNNRAHNGRNEKKMTQRAKIWHAERNVGDFMKPLKPDCEILMDFLIVITVKSRAFMAQIIEHR